MLGHDYYVGRHEEVELFGSVVRGDTPHSILNIYGPGGIGKTAVCEMIEAWCSNNKVPYAKINDDDSATEPSDKILHRLRDGCVESGGYRRCFQEFDRRFYEHLRVTDVIKRGGGIRALFDAAGKVVDPFLVRQLLTPFGIAIEGITAYFDNRDTLVRYVSGTERWLTEGLAVGLDSLAKRKHPAIVLLIDGYEMMLVHDPWVCNTLVQYIPDAVKLVILGRDKLTNINPDWRDHALSGIHFYELGELGENDAKTYLKHHDLQDEISLDRVYGFTGGYPLCLALAVQLKTELGGWEQVDGFRSGTSKDWVAQQLLERILKQPRTAEVQEFLEKGVVARWFDPGAISHILGVSSVQAQGIYHKMEKFSFVRKHPYGLQFHDRVRELLEERLKFMDGGEYRRLALTWAEYLAARAGVGGE